jgi:hypothetical protein
MLRATIRLPQSFARDRRAAVTKAQNIFIACRSRPGSFVVSSKPTEESDMKFLSFIRHPESHRQTPPPAALMEAMGEFIERSLKDGSLVDTGGLLPSKDGFRLRLANGKLTVTDGPFTESKEVIGDWAILSAATKADALKIASEFMELHRRHWPEFEGESEVRPMFDPGMGP